MSKLLPHSMWISSMVSAARTVNVPNAKPSVDVPLAKMLPSVVLVKDLQLAMGIPKMVALHPVNNSSNVADLAPVTSPLPVEAVHLMIRLPPSFSNEGVVEEDVIFDGSAPPNSG